MTNINAAHDERGKNSFATAGAIFITFLVFGGFAWILFYPNARAVLKSVGLILT